MILVALTHSVLAVIKDVAWTARVLCGFTLSFRLAVYLAIIILFIIQTKQEGREGRLTKLYYFYRKKR